MTPLPAAGRAAAGDVAAARLGRAVEVASMVGVAAAGRLVDVEGATLLGGRGDSVALAGRIAAAAGRAEGQRRALEGPVDAAQRGAALGGVATGVGVVVLLVDH